MDISNLLSTGGNFLTKLTESPVAAPLALATVAMFMKQRYPRFASGLAGQAVQEIFRPREEKQRAQELLLSRPDLTSSAPPAGYTGSVVPYGGINLRRLGTLGQEFPGDYGPGVQGAQMQASPAAFNAAMNDIPRTAAAPPAIPAAISKYNPSEQSWRGLVGGLPATPEGQTAAAKYGIESGLRAQEDQSAARTTQSLMDLVRGDSSLGFEAGVGKRGSPTFKVRTQQPRAANRYDMMKEELTPAERKTALMGAGQQPRSPTRISELVRLKDSGEMSPEAFKQALLGGTSEKETRLSIAQDMVRKGEMTPAEFKQMIKGGSTGPDSFTKTDYQMVAKQIVEVQDALTKMSKFGADASMTAPLEERLRSLQNELQAIKQTTQDFSAPAGAGNKASAVSDFIKRAQQPAR